VTKAKGKSRTVTGEEKLGTNVVGHMEGSKLHLIIDMDANHGKTPKNFRRIATTHGNVGGIPGYPTAKIGMTIYDTEG
jgi:hypothetical protein